MPSPSALPVEDAAAIRRAYELLATLVHKLPPADDDEQGDSDETDEATAA